MAYLSEKDTRDSLWHKTAPERVDYAHLSDATKAEITIIGGGYTGLSAALHLAENDHDVALLEARQIGWGASGRNGGQVNPALPVANPEELFTALPAIYAERLACLSLGSADFLFNLIGKHQIDCDARQSGWIRALHSRKAQKLACLSIQKWAEYGANMRLLSPEETRNFTGSATYSAAILSPSGGLVHPLKLAQGLAAAAHQKGARIYEESPMASLSEIKGGWRVQAGKGQIDSRLVIFATNAYSATFSKQTHNFEKQIRASILCANPIQIATDPLLAELVQTILLHGHSISDSRQMILYARREDDNRIIYGSIGQRWHGRHLSGFDWLEKDAGRIFLQLAKVKWPYRWGGQIALTETRLPHLTQLAKSVVAGLGYNGRGVAMANVMGKILADYAIGKPPSELSLPLLPPTPFTLGRFKQWALNSYITFAKTQDWLESK